MTTLQKTKGEMEEQENADYTVFLDLEKQILMDLGLVKGEEILSSSDAWSPLPPLEPASFLFQDLFISAEHV